MKTLKEKREYIRKLIQERKVSEFAKRNIVIGNEAFIKAKEVSKIGDVETMKSADGMFKAKKISDAFCNCNFQDKYGIEVDTYLAHTTKVPMLKIGDIRLTIKAVEDTEDIPKNASGYMEELVKNNVVLENQINMFAQIDGICKNEDEIENNEIYYGILAYHLDVSNDIEHITMVFYDSKFERELLKIETPKNLLQTKKVIKHEDKSPIDDNNVKHGDSLKEVLKLKNF